MLCSGLFDDCRAQEIHGTVFIIVFLLTPHDGHTVVTLMSVHTITLDINTHIL